MQYDSRHYADAFLSLYHDASESDRKHVVQKFAQALARHGALSRAHEIIALIRKRLVIEHGGRMVRIEFARIPSDDLLHTSAHFLSKKDFVETKVNPRLLAGIRITINEYKELDMSLKRIMDSMFHLSSL